MGKFVLLMKYSFFIGEIYLALLVQLHQQSTLAEKGERWNQKPVLTNLCSLCANNRCESTYSLWHITTFSAKMSRMDEKRCISVNVSNVVVTSHLWPSCEIKPAEKQLAFALAKKLD